jgi:opacity protein-like surface antigen
MKKIKQFVLFAVVLCGAMVSAQAQSSSEANERYKKGDLKINLFYDYGIPLGAFKSDYIKNGSPRGFNADILYWLRPQLGIGGSVGYQDYYQKNPRDLYKLPDGADISAVVTNSLQIIPVVAKAMYMPTAGKGAVIEPYVSVGAGINLINYSQYLGEFGGSQSNAKFTAQAGAGLKVPLGKNKNAGFLLGAVYNFSPYNENDIKNLNSVSLQAGFQFKLKK